MSKAGDRAAWPALMAAIAAVGLMSCGRAPFNSRRPEGQQNLLRNLHSAAALFGWTSFRTSQASRVSLNDGERGGGEIEIVNPRPGAAGLRRTVPVFYEGWYQFSGEVRTQGVGAGGLGAQLRIATEYGTLLPTPELHGTSGWRSIKIYYRPGRHDNLVSVICQLGGVKRPSAGKAWFRNLRTARMRGAPPPTAAMFSGDTLELDTAAMIKPPRSGGSAVSLLLLLFGCGATAALGWRLLA
jgi:hypothetical protein